MREHQPMSEPPRDEPDPDDLVIEPAVREIGLLEIGRAAATPTVLDAFSGLLIGEFTPAEDVTGAPHRHINQDLPGGPPPQLSYLTLRHLVVQELREPSTAPSGQDGNSSDFPGEPSGRAATSRPDPGGSDKEPEQLTVREFIRRRGDDSTAPAAEEPGVDESRDATRSRTDTAGLSTGRSVDQDSGMEPLPGTGDTSIGPSSSGSPPDWFRSSSWDPPRMESVQEDSDDAEAHPSVQPRSPLNRTAEGPIPDLEVRDRLGRATSGDSASRPSDPAASPHPPGHQGSGSGKGESLWSDLPRTVVVDRGQPTVEDTDSREAQPSSDSTLPGSHESRSTTPDDRPGSRTARSSTGLSDETLDDRVATSVATMDGEPFRRFVDRLSSELERKERVERERRGL